MPMDDEPTMEQEELLKSHLLHINVQIKAAMVSELWGQEGRVRPGCGMCDNSLFWNYYVDECTNVLHDAGRHIALRTHQDVVEVVRLLRTNIPRSEIKKQARSKLMSSEHHNEDELLDNSINLAASLLLMIDFCGSPYGFSGHTEMHWVQGSLADYLDHYFGEPCALTNTRVKLEKNFNARSLIRVAGLEIVWTDNLADHLLLSDDDTKVHIFHHATFLGCQKDRYECFSCHKVARLHRLHTQIFVQLMIRPYSDQSLLPKHLAAETLSTLALLLPSTEQDTRNWFFNCAAARRLDERAIQCGVLRTDRRRIESFSYWRDRLVTLKQVFDESQPKTLSQWWHDRRNGVQWYTFWVAVLVLVLTILFGLIQCIEGALQVYASFKAL